MAQLKDSVVSGNLRVTDTTLTDTLQVTTIKAPTSNGTTYTYGPGSEGQVLKSNGTTVYWGSDSNSVTGVKGNAESSYRTGNVNLTPANIGALALSGGTMTGNITFTPVTSTSYPASSNQLYWSGSTDWAKIYYRVDASDAGKLVFDIGDDTNTRIAFAYNGTAKSYIDTDGNFSGNAANVTGTVAIANGGTGATTRLNALKNLTNENVGSSANYFLTITSSWGKGGYTSVADAKTVLGLKSAAYTESSEYAPSSHTHGNITNGGALQTTDITIASGDKLVVTDSSDSNKVARASISFDGSTTSKCLTQKGTWETFASSNTDTKVTQNIVATTTDKNYPLLLSYYESSSSTTTAQTANRAVGIYANAKTSKITLTSGTADTSPGITATRTDTNASVSLMVGSGGTNHGVYSESMSKWLFVTNGTEAQTYNIVQNPSSTTTYAISFGGAGESGVGVPTNGTFTTGVKGHYINDGLGYRTREGVANGTEGLSALVLGNSLASSVAKNKTGYVRQYSTNEYYTDLKPNTLTASRTILLPDAAGTIAVFPAARTSGQVVVTDGTAGAVKSSGYTIAKSVPSNAVFTDTTYSAGTGLSLSGTTFNHSNSVTSVANYNKPYVKYDTQGHITGSSYWTATAAGTNDESGWIKVATMVHTGTHDNTPIMLLVSQRGNTITYKLHIVWKNTSNTDPDIDKFQLSSDIDTNADAYIKKSATSTWELYIKKLDTWEGIAMHLYVGKYFPDCMTWTWQDVQTAASAITGGIKAEKIVLYGHLDRAFIYDDNAVPSGHTWAEYAWHKFAEVTITTTWTDCVITFLVSRTIGNSAENTGILSAKLRTKGSKDYDSAQLKWLVRNSGLSKDDFVMVYTSTSGTSTKAELWCRLPDQYSGLIFTVLKEHKRQYSTDASWTLVKTPDGAGSTHGSSSYPTTGITDKIISSDGTITNSTTGTANRATYLDVVSFNEIRFYNNNQLKANDRFWIGYSWADGSHYTPSGGSDTSSTTAPNITKFIMGNCSAGGLASVHAKTFILGNGSSPTYSSKTTTIATAATTTDRTITLPDASGTIAVFPAARTSGQVVVTDGTAGGVKSSGYTIAKSVPSNAKFTDENVLQSETTATSYRPLVLGATYSTDPSTLAATITAQTYVSNLLYAQPSTGMLHANIFKAGKASTTDGEIKFYSSGSSNSGETTLKAKPQSTSGTYLLPACGNGTYTLSIGMTQVGGTGDSLVMSNVSGIPTGTLSFKIVFKSNASTPIYSMVEIPNMGDGVDCGGLIQVGDYTDGQGSTRIIMKAVIIRVTAGSTTGTKTFTATVSPTQKISGSSVSEFTRNVIIYKIYACC